MVLLSVQRNAGHRCDASRESDAKEDRQLELRFRQCPIVQNSIKRSADPERLRRGESFNGKL